MKEKDMDEELREMLKENILWRYDNEEYWDMDIIRDFEAENKKDKEEEDEKETS